MSFREKLNATAVEPAVRADSGASNAYKALKGRIHLKMLDKFDLTALENLTPEKLRQEIATMVERLHQEAQATINEKERRTLKQKKQQHKHFTCRPTD